MENYYSQYLTTIPELDQITSFIIVVSGPGEIIQFYCLIRSRRNVVSNNQPNNAPDWSNVAPLLFFRSRALPPSDTARHGRPGAFLGALGQKSNNWINFPKLNLHTVGLPILRWQERETEARRSIDVRIGEGPIYRMHPRDTTHITSSNKPVLDKLL